MESAGIESYKSQRIHMVGIGGASMSGLAAMLVHEGYLVSGSDSSDSYTLSHLRNQQVDVRAGHYPDMVQGAGLLVYSAAIAPDDPERLEAARLGIPQMERAVMLGELMKSSRQQICVCGTHGKTTTTAMIAQILNETGADPSVHLGGSLDAIGGSTKIGRSGLFVAEACEFNRSFLHMPVTLAVLLNIEEDHLDCYGDMQHVEDAYLQFLEKLPVDGTVLALGSDVRVLRVLSRLAKFNRQVLTFGMETSMVYSISQLEFDSAGNASFLIKYHDMVLCKTSLNVPGGFNALHALAALGTAHQLGADMQSVSDSLSHFTGAHRRFEHTGQVRGMELYHDYGHNPAEMQAALDMAKLQNRRVIAVMQPHTFSRVNTLYDEYLTCTREADITLVTDIFAAREKDPGDIRSQMLVDGMRANGIQAYFTPGFEETEEWLLKNGMPGDLVITMGCGNINLLNDQMQQHEEQTHPSN